MFPPYAYPADAELSNDVLLVRISAGDGSYAISAKGAASPVIWAGAAAELDHRWIRSTEYPRHEVAVLDFKDALGQGRQAVVRSTGAPDRPDLTYTIRVYQDRPFGQIQLQLDNHSARSFQVESLRTLEAVGHAILNLHASASFDRTLPDSFSEDWPPLRIYDLGQAPNGMIRAVGSQLVYNQQSKESVFLGTLTCDRLLTIFHLKTQAGPDGLSIASFTVDATGTTEIQATDEESGLREGPRENLIELSLPLPSGASMPSERLMFAVGSDYLAQLANYGAAIRELHASRIPENNLLGWWSWTAYYTKITAGNTFSNARWLAQHLKPLGYDYFHFDLGYGYSRGEYATPNAAQFPQGMWSLTRRICGLGLHVGIWTAPFEVGARSAVYQQHKDWLVHNMSGKPIQITTAEEMPGEAIFVLDATHPGAQEFLRATYRTLVREWGVKYIKLDFMDNTAIEGAYFRPNTTALEAQRIGLQVIRDATGDDVLLDKDGSPMLNPVGLVDTGRVSQDTGHTFARSKEAAPGIAARFYMHRNFFLNDPDAFTVSRQLVEEREIQAPLSIDEARVSIALAAVSGGMYEIGDDLPTLGSDPDRLALLENPDLLQMVKFGRGATPVDLLSYPAEDEQPSIFLLGEDARQSMLAVFNWTEQPRSHRLPFSWLRLSPGRTYHFQDIFEPAHLVSAEGDSILLEQPAHSVRLIKIIDTSLPSAAPSITVQVPDQARVGEDLKFVCSVDSQGVPALGYRWEFGDGTTDQGRQVAHAYTMPGTFKARLVVEGMDGIPAEARMSISVNGALVLPPPTRYQAKP
ncbi:MAG TPA: PKD domain-containing protein [Terriglobales bacterium]|nr:PKD domain-containing protein [Terriglobales bacterium]